MAQEGVVKESLTEGMIQGGAELTKKLDERGGPAQASLWVFISERNH